MSLRVWLPLTKDLRNQGLDDIPSFQLISGNSFITGGKIGEKAFNITKQQRILSNTSCMTGKKQMSYAFWVKVNTVWTTQWLDGIAWYSTDGTSASYSRQEFYNNCTKVGTWFKSSSLGGYDFNPEEWTHIAATFNYNTGEAKFYLNGELKGTSNGLSTSDYCRGDFYIGDSGLDILENDVRIYDHALSPLEVKQISQGLVLHYPLNRNGWGQENLLKNSNDLTLWNKESGVNCEYDLTVKMYKVFSTTRESSRWGIYQDYSVSVDVDTEYTFSLTGKTDGFRSYLSFGAGSSWPTNYTAFDNNKQRLSKTLTIPAGTTNIRVYLAMYPTTGGGYTYFEKPKLEIGNKATPWCPNSADELYNTLGLNDDVEYDTSGYGNNGTKINTLIHSSDTPKYNISTHFGATNQKIHIDNLITTGFSNSYSFAWWGKRSSNTPMFWGFSNGNRLNGMYYGYLWNTGDGTSNPIYKPNTTTQITAPSLNTWHHYVMTGDGTTCKLYLDGELYGQAKTYKSITGTSIYINGWDSGTAYCHDNMDMSDFRIYATALSADDVKSLYQNSAYIDNQGNIYGAVYEEV